MNTRGYSRQNYGKNACPVEMEDQKEAAVQEDFFRNWLDHPIDAHY